MKLWIDEMRQPPKGWEWARNVDEAFKHLENEEIHALSMDYHLSLLVSLGVGTQYEVKTEQSFGPVAIFITYAFQPNSFPVEIHSDSEDGKENLAKIFEGWELTYKEYPQPDKSPEQEVVLVEVVDKRE